MQDQFTIEWNDSGREPQCPPNPEYPNGIALDVTHAGGGPSCEAQLPYPAKRCGHYVVRCNLCDYSVVCTTAGRPDDPRSLRMPCRLAKGGVA
jgi:hypothetical protein